MKTGRQSWNEGQWTEAPLFRAALLLGRLGARAAD